jgi:hypothetical protein
MAKLPSRRRHSVAAGSPTFLMEPAIQRELFVSLLPAIILEPIVTKPSFTGALPIQDDTARTHLAQTG